MQFIAEGGVKGETGTKGTYLEHTNGKNVQLCMVPTAWYQLTSMVTLVNIVFVVTRNVLKCADKQDKYTTNGERKNCPYCRSPEIYPGEPKY